MLKAHENEGTIEMKYLKYMGGGGDKINRK